MGSALQLLRHHLRLGYINAILAIDSIFLLLIGLDLWRYVDRGLYLPLALRIEHSPADRMTVLLFAAFLVVVAPIGIALLRIVIGRGMLSRGLFTIGGRETLVLHGVACVLLVYCAFVAARMETLSGYVQMDSLVRYSFVSLYYGAIHSGLLVLIFKYALSLTASAMAAAVGFALIGKTPGRQMEVYKVRAELADLPGELKPALAAARYSFDEGGASTEVAFVRDFESTKVCQYQRLNPGSQAACAFVARIFAQCQERIEQLLIPQDGSPRSIGIAPSAYEALAATLEAVCGTRRIVVLPFAESYVISAARRHARISGSQVHLLTLEPRDYLQSWQEQEAKILDQLRRLPASDGTRPVVIVTEVCYATGLRLPLGPFIPRLREALGGQEVTIIVEGSQAAGNGSIVPAMVHADAYVFTTDRWLLSTAPFGVTVNFAPGASAPSGWLANDGQIPATYSDARRFANLLGSLELLAEYGFEYFWKRCRKLRAQFLLLLPAKVQIVGDAAGLEKTFFLSVCPAAGNTWRLPASELTQSLQERLIYAPLLQMDPAAPWLRVSFPYFLDVRELNRLCYSLDELAR